MFSQTSDNISLLLLLLVSSDCCAEHFNFIVIVGVRELLFFQTCDVISVLLLSLGDCFALRIVSIINLSLLLVSGDCCAVRLENVISLLLLVSGVGKLSPVI